jgi:16S rRNA (guanine1207-N2)-methyltransferase
MKSEHYFTERPKSKPRKAEFSLNVNGMPLHFETIAGVFSKKGLDKGSEVLLKHMKLPEKGDILDLGCGYGVIGIVAAISRPKCKVTLADINQRAVRISKKNLKENGVENGEAVKSDLFKNLDGKFDCILCNPPISAGMESVFAIVEQSEGYLNSDGTLQLVARARKGGTRIEIHMKEVFGNVEDVGRGAGYHVYISKHL